jgi:hypothetical protein
MIYAGAIRHYWRDWLIATDRPLGPELLEVVGEAIVTAGRTPSDVTAIQIDEAGIVLEVILEDGAHERVHVGAGR